MKNKKDVIQRMEDNIAEFGFSVISVFAGEETPSFSYTVGLFESKGHPEIIMAGFEPSLMQKLLQDTGVRVLNDLGTYSDGDFALEIIEGYPVAIKNPPVGSLIKNPFTMATRHYGSDPFKMVQMFLPDAAGLFPWDAGCNVNFAKEQLRLLANYDGMH